MKAMVLAAGLGTRLGVLGAAMPKILIDVGGRSLLARHVEFLVQLGVERIVINTHHHADQVEKSLSELQAAVDVTCVHEPELLGTAGGVRNALEALGPDPFVVMYGDVLFPDPMDGMIDAHAPGGAAATLAVHSADSAVGKGVVETDATGGVVRFVEKGAGPAGPALINSGFYVLNPDVVERVPAGTFSDFGRDVFPALLAEGAVIHTHRLPRPVIDIGTPEGLELARSLAGATPKLRGEV
jgi:NDP-sugar pyrophosphorylase family protein